MIINKEFSQKIENCIKQTHINVFKKNHEIDHLSNILNVGSGVACFLGNESFLSQVIAWGFNIDSRMINVRRKLKKNILMSKSNRCNKKNELSSLMNVGEAICKDFELLGIKSIAELAKASADELFVRLQVITGQPHDPCVWDVFSAAINEARTGEKHPWWEWDENPQEATSNWNFLRLEW